MLLLSDDGSKYVAGQVWFHAAYAEEPCSLVSIWTLLSADENTGSAEWQEADNPVLVPMQEIIGSLVYTRLRPGVVRTLIPIQHHSRV